jgi:ABC-type Fe3+/spermidine/putrescine transport system ATPase subunit
MNPAAVALKHVTKGFGGRSVITDVSLDVVSGSTLTILGPSGSGKTTVLRLIAGLESPDAGEVWLSGRLASSRGRLLIPPARRNAGFVFQDLALWPHMTVAGNLRFVLESRRWPLDTRRARIEEILEIVGMSDRAAEYPAYLSGGEQQRVALARALVSNPDLLLLDEPLASLDPELRAELREELSTIPKKLDVTMIYVTHDTTDIEAFGGQQLVLTDHSKSTRGRRS